MPPVARRSQSGISPMASRLPARTPEARTAHRQPVDVDVAGRRGYWAWRGGGFDHAAGEHGSALWRSGDPIPLADGGADHGARGAWHLYGRPARRRIRHTENHADPG